MVIEVLQVRDIGKADIGIAFPVELRPLLRLAVMVSASVPASAKDPFSSLEQHDARITDIGNTPRPPPCFEEVGVTQVVAVPSGTPTAPQVFGASGLQTT